MLLAYAPAPAPRLQPVRATDWQQILAFIVGFMAQDIRLALYVGLAGTALTFVVVVPQWPFYNKNPESWLPASNAASQYNIDVAGEKVG